MHPYLKLFAAAVLALTAFTAQAGLFDDLGNALRGDTKKEESTTEPSNNNVQPSRGLARVNTVGGKRIALVIGNGKYRYTDTLPKLANPPHDAEDIAKALRGFGFEVIEKKDQSLEGMSDAITEFSRKLGNSEAALFYYAGHGMQVSGKNYIIPVDAKIETEAQVAFKSIDINMVLGEMDNGKSRINIVMLDACRNNDFSGKFRSTASRGLAAPSSQPKGTVIVYATDPGNVAADGNGRNGLFTAGLLTAFKGSDLTLQGVLLRASEEVDRGSNQKQMPYVNGPPMLQKSFQFGQGTQVASLEPVPTPGYVSPAPARGKTREEIEDNSWSAADAASTPEAFKAYLSGYPKGRYVTQAKIKLATLKKTAQETRTAEPISAREDNDTVLWNEAHKGGAREDYQTYLSQYPKGKYTALAKRELKKIDDEAVQQVKQQREDAARQAAQQEQLAWESANSNASEDSYQNYLNSYPKGRFAALAQGRISKLKKAAAQQITKAEVTETIETSSKPKADPYGILDSSGNCMFAESPVLAPSWVCDEAIEGMEARVGASQSSAAGHDFMIQMAATDARMRLAHKLNVPQASLQENARIYKSISGPSGSIYVLLGWHR